MTKDKETFLKELKKRFPNNKIEILEYQGASKPIRYKCLQCGREYFKNRANHLYENKTLCQKCYTARKSEIRKKFLYKINKSKNFELLEQSIGATSDKVKIKCLKCGREQYVLMHNFIKQEHSCKYCGQNGSPVDLKEFYRRMQESGKEGYEVLKYKKFTERALFKHIKCGQIFSQLPSNFLQSRGCPKCYKKVSKGEQKILSFLKNNNISFEYQKKFKELGKRSYDFYLPQDRILIEYQGEQHYFPAGYYGGEQKFYQQQKSDQIKREYAEKNNYFLLEIPYYKYNEIENILSFLKGSTTIPEGSTTKQLEKEL